MYRICKEMEISVAHSLCLPYESACNRTHGHNFLINVYVQSEDLINGMVIDFVQIKHKIHDKLDHGYLNEIFGESITAEQLCKWIADEINLIRQGATCYKVTAQETRGNVAEWSLD